MIRRKKAKGKSKKAKVLRRRSSPRFSNCRHRAGLVRMSKASERRIRLGDSKHHSDPRGTFGRRWFEAHNRRSRAAAPHPLSCSGGHGGSLPVSQQEKTTMFWLGSKSWRWLPHPGRLCQAEVPPEVALRGLEGGWRNPQRWARRQLALEPARAMNVSHGQSLHGVESGLGGSRREKACFR